MEKQVDQLRKEELYDAVIIGGGIAGLCAAYKLRDKNVLLLEEEDRFGGRVMSEQVNDTWYNIGTQYVNEEKNDFNQLLDELGIEKINHGEEPLFSVYSDNKLYPDFDSFPLSLKEKIDAFKFISRAYRKLKIFKLPPEDPRWKELVRKNLEELQQGYSPRMLMLFNIYLLAACVSTPENTSMGIGAGILFDIVNPAQISFIKGGTQKITDTLAKKLDGNIMSQARVTKVEEKDGIVSTSFHKNGKDHVIKSKKAVLATPAPIALKLVPQLPDWKKEALSKVEYGLLIIINIFLKRSVPWKRWGGMMSEGVIFNGIMDPTFNTDADKNEDNPIIYNFVISKAPQDKEGIEALMSKSDQELLTLVKDDFKRIMSESDIDQYITDTKVTRYPLGEVGISPEFYTELLPHLPKPVGNIHFCGDYTDRFSFLEGSALSGFRVARELGSKLVPSEADEVRFGKTPLWGKFGWAAMICNIVLIVCGFFLPGISGPIVSSAAFMMLCIILIYPSFFVPLKDVYKVFLYISLGLGGIGLLTGLL
ncbi:MAG: FAD-dependent oxidoreductase [Desulfobacterales bacterium]|nr:FAD-dependent oxidoreductase [Desulfobacterales bacterium]